MTARQHFNRHDSRCDFCGRFMTWARWASYNCFAGFRYAWCQRPNCEEAADQA